MSDETRNKLISALRQFRHNNDNTGPIASPEQGFVFAYDRDETEGLVASLEKKLEQAEARCAELEAENESLWETFVKVSDYLGIDNEAARKIPGKPSSVFRSAILRKQAEAVEAANDSLRGEINDIPGTTLSPKERSLLGGALRHIEQCARKLHQQATEIERGTS